MTRRERRIRHRRVRRVLASVTALGVLGMGVGLAGPAVANNGRDNNNGPGNFTNCTGDDQANASIATENGQSWHACIF
jgi:hypothetical protein